MLTAKELNEVQGLINYLNENMHEVKPGDFKLIDSNGEEVALVGIDPPCGEYVLKVAYLQ